jgi:hypothetical protein
MHGETTDHFVGSDPTLVVKAVQLAESGVYRADNRSLGFAEASPAHRTHFAQAVRESASLQFRF